MSRTHRPARQALVALAIAAASFAGPAAAGQVRGTLRAPTASAPTPAMNAYPGRANAIPGVLGPARGRVADAVAYIAKIPAAAESLLARKPQARPQLAQKQEAFVPRVAVVARGGSVDFPNQDPIYHNVFSLSPTKRFDLGKYRQGQSKAVVFDRTGLVKVFCDIHSEMEAFVLVVPNHAYARVRVDGSFELPELPAGRYELRVWHPDLPEIVRAVQVVEQGETRLDLSF